MDASRFQSSTGDGNIRQDLEHTPRERSDGYETPGPEGVPQDISPQPWQGPATLTLDPRSPGDANQEGGTITVRGAGWAPRCDVQFFFDGILHRTEPLAAGFETADQAGSFVKSISVEGELRHVWPGETATKVTLRGVGGGETATCEAPDFLFYTF
mgnify:FL=1